MSCYMVVWRLSHRLTRLLDIGIGQLSIFRGSVPLLPLTDVTPANWVIVCPSKRYTLIQATDLLDSWILGLAIELIVYMIVIANDFEVNTQPSH